MFDTVTAVFRLKTAVAASYTATGGADTDAAGRAAAVVRCSVTLCFYN
jgi:hypothetical protein